jgi:imidazole glycerol-phosphate synthase subunit HisH
VSVAIIDYGMGNLGSVARALEELGATPFIAEHPQVLATAERLILPGVGAFGEAMSRLNGGGWTAAIRNEVAGGKPLLGICLGMQLLASSSTEGGLSEGLNLVPGHVQRLDTLGCGERIPHVGWNGACLTARAGLLFEGIPDRTDFYFVHSFAMRAEREEDVLATVEYGVPLVASVARGHVFGTQFHPEKSSKAGFRILKNFLGAPRC